MISKDEYEILKQAAHEGLELNDVSRTWDEATRNMVDLEFIGSPYRDGYRHVSLYDGTVTVSITPHGALAMMLYEVMQAAG